jgi:hypothetical protein
VTLRKGKKNEEHDNESTHSPSSGSKPTPESRTPENKTPEFTRKAAISTPEFALSTPLTSGKEISSTPSTPSTPVLTPSQSMTTMESETSSAASSEHHSPENSDNESTMSKLKKFGSLGKKRGKQEPKPKPVSAAEIEKAMKANSTSATATTKPPGDVMMVELQKLREVQVQQQKQIEQLQQITFMQQRQHQSFQQQLEKVTTALNLPPAESPLTPVRERKISTTELNANDTQTPDKPLPLSESQSTLNSFKSDISDDDTLQTSTDSSALYSTEEAMAKNKRLPGERRRESMILAVNDLANL